MKGKDTQLGGDEDDDNGLVTKASADIDQDSSKIQDFFVKMLKLNSVNPGMGGPGETERADYIQSYLEGEGFSVTRVEVPDPAFRGRTRPNLCVRLEGRAGCSEKKTLWFLSHMDTVPEGTRDLWDSDPFDPVVKDGKIYARGAEDNGQSLAASLFALRELKHLGASLPFGVGAWFVADEENGSRYGVKYLLDQGEKYFGRGDLIVVPDAGSPDGTSVELAEKNLLWMKFVVRGRQVHASLPSKGVNSRRIGMKLALELDSFLHRKYDRRDPMFDEEASTFEPTKVEPNVPNVNTIPGVDAFYFDCRILPEYPLDQVLGDVREILGRYKKEEGGVGVELEVLNREDAGGATPEASEVSVLLSSAIKRVTNRRPRFVGIGGQTVGNLFRQKGLETVVWSTVDEVPHEPNEYSRFSNLLSDAKVFAAMALVA